MRVEPFRCMVMQGTGLLSEMLSPEGAADLSKSVSACRTDSSPPEQACPLSEEPATVG